MNQIQKISPPTNKAHDNVFLGRAKSNCINLLKHSQGEYHKYKTTNDIVYLQQSGNKLFAVIENLIEYIEKRDYSLFGQFMAYTKSKELKNLLNKSRDLHYFFYGGLSEGYPADIEKVYLVISEKIKTKVYNLK